MFCQLFSLQNKSFLCLQHVENKGFQTVIKHRLKAIQKPIKNELGNREKKYRKCTFRFEKMHISFSRLYMLVETEAAPASPNVYINIWRSRYCFCKQRLSITFCSVSIFELRVDGIFAISFCIFFGGIGQSILFISFKYAVFIVPSVTIRPTALRKYVEDIK